ncbi:hypothetical protein J31TS6_33960 [Brevibacillus reuszeri]|nr:hypothetical protein J31TS6_33960 [Brevibacillus reuszeri]
MSAVRLATGAARVTSTLVRVIALTLTRISNRSSIPETYLFPGFFCYCVALSFVEKRNIVDANY